MKKWTLVDDFIAMKLHDDGTMEERKFSSHAQARQFVERQNNEHFSKRHRPPTPGSRNRIRKKGEFKAPTEGFKFPGLE